MAHGWLTADAPAPEASALDLARVLHKLAGTAAMFGEPALGEAAAALERALVAAPPSGPTCVALAEALLAEGRALADTAPPSRSARG